jgi:ribosomal protein S18 acetylase RimI-like enzyme
MDDLPVDSSDRVLDNPAWHALIGPRRSLGRVTARAGQFDEDVSPFAALCDDPGPAAWAELADLVGDSGRALLVGARGFSVPAPWEVRMRLPLVQMVAHGPIGSSRRAHGDSPKTIALDVADVPEMTELVDATEPGPFGPRTIEFGGFIGVRESGRLIAMAGERLRCACRPSGPLGAVTGLTELTAVCTAADHRGRGLGTLLVTTLVDRIRARGEEAFLHTAAANTTAIRLYEELGFTLRREFDVLGLKRVAP